MLLHVLHASHDHDYGRTDHHDYNSDDHDNDCHYDYHVVPVRPVDKRRLRTGRMPEHADVPGQGMHAVGMQFAEQVRELRFLYLHMQFMGQLRMRRRRLR